MPTIGQSVHAPPNQCWTAEYHSNVVGSRTKPTMGHKSEGNSPSNQWVKNQRRPTASRGVTSARAAKMQGMAENDRIARRPVSSGGMERDVQPLTQVCLGFHDLSTCFAFFHGTASTRCLGGTPLGCGHPPTSAFLGHFRNRLPFLGVHSPPTRHLPTFCVARRPVNGPRPVRYRADQKS